MKSIISESRKKQAYDDGLGPDSVDCAFSTRWAKVTMVAADVRGDHVSFTKNRVMIKAEERFRSKHSVMCGYLYSVTALMTHFFEGNKPTWMRDNNTVNISEATKDTLKMVRQAMETKDIYPENPNIVFLTDDTTLFL